jgi:hypothetical protein
MEILPVVDEKGKTLNAHQLHLIAMNNSEIISHDNDVELKITVGERFVSFFVEKSKLHGLDEDESKALELKRLLIDSYVLMYHKMLNSFSQTTKMSTKE